MYRAHAPVVAEAIVEQADTAVRQLLERALDAAGNLSVAAREAQPGQSAALSEVGCLPVCLVVDGS